MSLTDCYSLREEHRLKVFENRVLRLIFGPKTDEVTGEWRKLHNGKINNLHFSTNIYIYIYIYIWHNSPQWAMASSSASSLDHTQRRTTVGRTPLDE